MFFLTSNLTKGALFINFIGNLVDKIYDKKFCLKTVKLTTRLYDGR
jgi:hypothetical protein